MKTIRLLCSIVCVSVWLGWVHAAPQVLLGSGAIVTNPVTYWYDSFNAPNGTSITTTPQWLYTNLGVETNSTTGGSVPRLDAQDKYYSSNNMLYCYVGPCTNDPLIYNKVQAGLTPLNPDGYPAFVVLTNGRLAVECDFTAAEQNAGNQWGLGQEFKVSLTSFPILSDPGIWTNMYVLKVRVNPGGAGVMFFADVAYTGRWHSVYASGTISNAFAAGRRHLRMELRADGGFNVLMNGVLVGSATNVIPPALMPEVFVQIWHGKFNGSGGVVSDGSLMIDNFLINAGAQLSIAEARAAGWPAQVTVGPMTINTTNDLTASGYSLCAQDGGDGITLYGTGATLFYITNNLLAQGLKPGDSIVVSGSNAFYRGLYELMRVVLVTNYGNEGVPVPAQLTIADLQNDAPNAERYENQLIIVSNLVFTNSGTFANAINYPVTNANGMTAFVRLQDVVDPLMGTPIPALPCTIVGILSQFGSNTTVHIGPHDGYQFLPLSIVPVPEPAALAVGALALLMVARPRRRSS